MSIRKTAVAVKLAAAALAVAGLVGTGWAQSVVPGLISGGSSYPGDKTMGVVYNIVKEAKMAITANNPKKDNILGRDPAITEVSGSKNGNLGLIQVTTNSTGWDILLATDNGGQLMKGTKTAGDITQKWDNSCTCLKPDTAWTITGVPLKYGGGSPTPVQLKVAIGMLDNVNGTTKVLKGIPTQDVTTSYAAAIVADGKLTASKVVVANPTQTPVSFIETLQALPTSPAGIADLTVGGVKVMGNTNAPAAGFGPTSYEYTGDNAIKRDGSEWFFVNVGIPVTDAGTFVASPTGNKISGNEDGDYKETFTFTLKALF
jgi:hypothetical protein